MEQNTSLKPSRLSTDSMLESIKVSMEHLEDEVSDMAEMLAQLLPERTEDISEMTI